MIWAGGVSLVPKALFKKEKIIEKRVKQVIINKIDGTRDKMVNKNNSSSVVETSSGEFAFSINLSLGIEKSCGITDKVISIKIKLIKIIL
jgi:hypothetical protein